LRAEDTERAGAGAIAFRRAMREHVLHEVEILAHKRYMK